MDCIGSSIFYETPGIESYTNTKEEIREHSPSLQSDDNNQPFVFVTIRPEHQNNMYGPNDTTHGYYASNKSSSMTSSSCKSWSEEKAHDMSFQHRLSRPAFCS